MTRRESVRNQINRDGIPWRLFVLVGLMAMVVGCGPVSSADDGGADDGGANDRGGDAAGEAAGAGEAAEAETESADAAVERTRDVVRMLDDIYKTSIVLITTHYVEEDSDLPAGAAFKALFAMVKEKGWHEVRLVDATGEPYNDENLPTEGFEQGAIAKIKAGEAYVDEVVEEDGKRYLLAATAIPVVMQKCTMCHANYEDAADGEAIGALAYRIEVN